MKSTSNKFSTGK